MRCECKRKKLLLHERLQILAFVGNEQRVRTTYNGTDGARRNRRLKQLASTGFGHTQSCTARRLGLGRSGAGRLSRRFECWLSEAPTHKSVETKLKDFFRIESKVPAIKSLQNLVYHLNQKFIEERLARLNLAEDATKLEKELERFVDNYLQRRDTPMRYRSEALKNGLGYSNLNDSWDQFEESSLSRQARR